MRLKVDYLMVARTVSIMLSAERAWD